jgi:hypothetical protein
MIHLFLEPLQPLTLWTPNRIDHTHDAEIRSALARGNPRLHPTTPRTRLISGRDQRGSQGLAAICTGMSLYSYIASIFVRSIHKFGGDCTEIYVE